MVPVGPENIEKAAYVEVVDYHSREDAPYPIEKTKRIIRRAEELEYRESEASDNVIYSSTGENGSTVVWARIKDGCLEIEGQDLGHSCYPDGEHEYFYSFDDVETRRFSELMTGQTNDLDLFIARFRGKIKGPLWHQEFTYFCERHGLKYKGFSC